MPTGSVFLTEVELKKTADERGNRRKMNGM